MKKEKPKSLTLEQEQEIMSYPVYLQYHIRQEVLKGEDVKVAGKRMEELSRGLT